jgi:hypothetical protein
VPARIFHESPSRDRKDGSATGQPQGLGPGGAGLCARLNTIQAGTEAGPTSTSQGLRPENARKDAHIRGRSR